MFLMWTDLKHFQEVIISHHVYNLCNPFRQSCFLTHIIMATQSNAGYYADRKQPERCQTDDRWPQWVDVVAGTLKEDDLTVEMKIEV